MNIKRPFILPCLIALHFVVFENPVWGQNPPLKTGMDIKKPQKIEVEGVRISNFAGKVLVNSTGSHKTVTVSLNGADELLNQINVMEEKGSLSIAFDKDAPIVKDVDKLTLTVNMPATMPLELELLGGKAVVGNRESKDTKLIIKGFGDIKVASVKNIESKIIGSGEIIINKIEGNAKIKIQGDGKYDILKGNIPFLKAKIQGTGLINILASVKDASLNSEGAGTMKLATVKGELQQTMSGAGTISIAKISGSLKNRSFPPRPLKGAAKVN